MARGSRGAAQQPLRRPVNLTGIISLTEKNDLFSLVNTITEKMHQDIMSIFDTSFEIGANEHDECHHWLPQNIPGVTGEHIFSVHPGEHNGQDGPCNELSCSQSEEVLRQEEREATASPLYELQKEISVHFRKWQGIIIQRLRDLVVSDPSLANQSNPRGRGRGAAGINVGRGFSGRRGGRFSPTTPLGPPRVPAQHMDTDLARRWPPAPNHLWMLPLEKRKTLLHVTLLLLLSLQEYSANSRLVLIKLTSSLNLPLHILQDDEVRIGKGLAQACLESLGDDPERKPEVLKGSRRWKMGMGRGSSSGKGNQLAAPLLAVGIGTLHGGMGVSPAAAAALLGTMSDNGHLIGSLFGMNPSRPTGKTMESYARDTQDFGFVPLSEKSWQEFSEPKLVPSEDRRLRLVIVISGWLTEVTDIVTPWKCLGDRSEVYAMRWEVGSLLSLGGSLATIIRSAAWENARNELQPRKIASCLADSLWPISLLKVSKIMDTPWNVGMVRAEKAGIVLADAVMRSKLQGERPVSFIGYSLAARAIYACLMVLAERRQFGVVESVVMMGTPAPSDTRVWLTLRSVVSGRLINVYSEDDYMLGFLYRNSNYHFGIAGLQDVKGVRGVENHPVTLKNGHVSYQDIAGHVLKDVGWEDLNVKHESTAADLADRQPLVNRGRRL